MEILRFKRVRIACNETISLRTAFYDRSKVYIVVAVKP